MKNRKEYIGSSDISSIVNLNKYRSAYEVWYQKTTGEETPDNDAMFWGRTLEPAILFGTAQRYEYEIVHSNHFATHDVHTFFGATADAIGIKDKVKFVVEIKCTTNFNKHFNETDVPQEYILQAMWLMGIHKVNECRFYVLFNGNKDKEYIYKFDEELFNQLVEKALQFWELVQTNTPPEMIVAEDINRIELTDQEVEADEEMKLLCIRLKDVNRYIKLYETEKKEIMDRIKLFLKGKTTLVSQGEVVCKMTRQKKEILNKEKIKKYLKENFSEVVTNSNSTVLRFKNE